MNERLLAPAISTGCVQGAVRDATPGSASSDESSAAPLQHGRWLFSHTGALEDWSRAGKMLFERRLDVPEASAAVDSAVLFELAGASLGDVLRKCLRAAQSVAGGRLSFLAADGDRLAATSHGDPLLCQESDAGAAPSCEPFADDPGWRRPPARSLTEVSRLASGPRLT